MLAFDFADLVNGDDVWMPQSCGCLSLTLETLDRRLARESPEQEKLERDHTIEFPMVGPVNDAHSTVAEFFQQDEVAEKPLIGGSRVNRSVDRGGACANRAFKGDGELTAGTDA